MKGFIDEIPKEYEEAALVDGYTRMQSFFKIVLPEAATGTRRRPSSALSPLGTNMPRPDHDQPPGADSTPFIPSQIGSGLPDWTTIQPALFCSCCR